MNRICNSNQWIAAKITLEERFWSKVEKTETCWLWKAAISRGYGLFSVNGRYRPAHRVAYELEIGPILPGLQLDHLCRVRNCVNPAHLEAVTPQINQLRSDSASGLAARKTHCPAGHPYDAANTYVFRTSRGGLGRQCRICTVARTRAWREARRREVEFTRHA